MHKGFWWGDLRERDHLQDRDVDGSSKNGVGHAQDMSARG